MVHPAIKLRSEFLLSENQRNLRICGKLKITIPALTIKPGSAFSTVSIALILFLFLTNTQAVAQSVPEWKFFKGRVKSCKEECFKAKECGTLVDKTMHKREPNTGNDFEILYDSLGKKILLTEFEFDAETIKNQHQFTYDGYNQLAEVRITSRFGNLIKSTRYMNTYDSTGRLLGRYVNYSDNTGPVGYTYSYSEQGTVCEYFLVKNGIPQNQLPSREFDSAGHVTKYWSYTAKNKLTGYAVLTYDSLGNKIREELFDRTDFNYLNYTWKFSGHELVRHEICKANGNSCESWTYKYEYDKMGNWVRCVEYRNGKAAYVKERKISYW